MHQFLIHNRDELIKRCKSKVAKRPLRAATADQLKNGVPLFLDQLTQTLRAEREGEPGTSLRISGAPGGGDASSLSEIGLTATAHGRQLLELGYTVNQVVHDPPTAAAPRLLAVPVCAGGIDLASRLPALQHCCRATHASLEQCACLHRSTGLDPALQCGLRYHFSQEKP